MSFENARSLAPPLLSLAAVIALPMAAHAAASRPPVLSGAAVIHDLAKMGGRYCFAGHVHYGSSAGQPTQAKAKAEAILSWYELVDLEYGAQWSSYNISAAKKVSCLQSGQSWGCEIHAIPCSR
jgi:hypothetical protein